MPELPDVEGFRRTLSSCARGHRIERVEVADAGVLHGVSARQLKQRLEGRRFAEPERRGKWLLAHTDGPTVMVHFGMTGSLVCCSEREPRHPHDRVVLGLDQHDDLRYRDQRKLQGIWLTDDADNTEALADQGPDAAAVSRAAFDELLEGRRGAVKGVLTDQSALAGLGNLLTDEILWHARIAPSRRANELSADERKRLHDSMRRVLRESMRAGQVPPRPSWLTGHRDDRTATCPRCGTRLRHGRMAGRGTVWCPHCQPDGS